MTLLLSRSETLRCVVPETIDAAVESAFRQHAQSGSLDGLRHHAACVAGAFHTVIGGLTETDDSAGRFAVKVNARFSQIRGFISLFDAESGELLAVLDSMAATSARTSSLTAIAVRTAIAAFDTESETESDTEFVASPARGNPPLQALVVGGGRQIMGQIDALRRVAPSVNITVAARDPRAARDRLKSMLLDTGEALSLTVISMDEMSVSARSAKVIVTATSATQPVLKHEDVAPGTIVIAIGADSPGKNELSARLLTNSSIICDLEFQCRTHGETQWIPPNQAVWELGSLLSEPTRWSDFPTDRPIVIDSTGTALQDVAAAVVIVERAKELGLGMEIDLHA